MLSPDKRRVFRSHRPAARQVAVRRRIVRATMQIVAHSRTRSYGECSGRHAKTTQCPAQPLSSRGSSSFQVTRLSYHIIRRACALARASHANSIIDVNGLRSMAARAGRKRPLCCACLVWLHRRMGRIVQRAGRNQVKQSLRCQSSCCGAGFVAAHYLSCCVRRCASSACTRRHRRPIGGFAWKILAPSSAGPRVVRRAAGGVVVSGRRSAPPTQVANHEPQQQYERQQ